jgi:AraC-like DNA-binding protein
MRDYAQSAFSRKEVRTVPAPFTGTLALSTDAAPESERLNLLREFFARIKVRYEAKPIDGSPITIELKAQALPGMQVLSGRLHGARYWRSVESANQEEVGLVVNTKGRQLIAQANREIVLDAGEATLVSLTDPLESIHNPPSTVLALRFPKLKLAPLVRGLEDRYLRPIPLSEPLKLLIGYLDLAPRDHSGLNPALHQTVAGHLCDLAALAIGATREARVGDECKLRAVRLHAIKADIERNLQRPDLSVGTVAQRHHCTVRCVQRLFETEGTTFTTYLLGQRLARARRMLSDLSHGNEKISAIAYDCGFADLSYFNRAFRRVYGASPSEVRPLSLGSEVNLVPGALSFDI